MDSIYDIVWARDPETGAPVTYGEVRLAEELQFSVYNFELADVPSSGSTSICYEAEAQALLGQAERAARERKGQRQGKAAFSAAGHV